MLFLSLIASQCGRRWHPAHVDWTLHSLPGQDHPMRPSADEEVFVAAVVVSNENCNDFDNDGSDSESNCLSASVTMKHLQILKALTFASAMV